MDKNKSEQVNPYADNTKPVWTTDRRSEGESESPKSKMVDNKLKHVKPYVDMMASSRQQLCIDVNEPDKAKSGKDNGELNHVMPYTRIELPGCVDIRSDELGSSEMGSGTNKSAPK